MDQLTDSFYRKKPMSKTELKSFSDTTVEAEAGSGSADSVPFGLEAEAVEINRFCFLS